jgi:hypothetical protein
MLFCYVFVRRVSSILLFIFITASAVVNAQSFGFGCLGFVGGYGGYSYQEYKPDGLNNYVDVFNQVGSDSLISPMEKFGKATGYRVGLNFFRAKMDNFVLTTKGYYQLISENHEALEKYGMGTRSTSLKLEMMNWGVGIDLGISITKAISWKVVDGAVNFNNITLTRTENKTGAQTTIEKYKTKSTNLGYSIGTGFILDVIDEYLSIEGVAAYTKLSVDNLKMDDGTVLTENQTSTTPMTNFINAGGFNAVVQLNVGFPL